MEMAKSERGYRFLNSEESIIEFIDTLDTLVAIHETIEPEPGEDIEMYFFNLEKLIDCSIFLKGYLGIKIDNQDNDSDTFDEEF